MMPQFVKDFLASGLVQARILKGIRAASLFAGGWTLSHLYDWLMAHATFFSQADNMAIAGTVSAAVAGLVLTGGSAFYGIIVDPKNVDAKIKAVAATGDASTANNPQIVSQVKAASGSPAALQQVLATLAAGKE